MYMYVYIDTYSGGREVGRLNEVSGTAKGVGGIGWGGRSHLELGEGPDEHRYIRGLGDQAGLERVREQRLPGFGFWG